MMKKNDGNTIQFGNAFIPLGSTPIEPDWVLEGNPVARSQVLSTSNDGLGTTVIWDCTPGRFNWFYSVDETVYLLQGSVTIVNQRGLATKVGPGDSVFFPAGSWAQWTVHEQVRKVAFCRQPLPRYLKMVQRAAQLAKRVLRPGRSGQAEEPVGGMFGSPA